MKKLALKLFKLNELEIKDKRALCAYMWQKTIQYDISYWKFYFLSLFDKTEKWNDMFFKPKLKYCPIIISKEQWFFHFKDDEYRPEDKENYVEWHNQFPFKYEQFEKHHRHAINKLNLDERQKSQRTNSEARIMHCLLETAFEENFELSGIKYTWMRDISRKTKLDKKTVQTALQRFYQKGWIVWAKSNNKNLVCMPQSNTGKRLRN